jgi:hypothetical protein
LFWTFTFGDPHAVRTQSHTFHWYVSAMNNRKMKGHEAGIPLPILTLQLSVFLSFLYICIIVENPVIKSWGLGFNTNTLCTGCQNTQVLWEHKFLSDVTGCRKTQVSDCTSYTVLTTVHFIPVICTIRLSITHPLHHNTGSIRARQLSSQCTIYEKKMIELDLL